MFREGSVYSDPTGVGGTPDPEGKAIKCLTDQVFALEKQVEELSKKLDDRVDTAKVETIR